MLKGRTALVTGSTSGLGLAIAQEMAKAGASVMLNGFGDVEGAKSAVSEFGGKVAYHGADLTKPAEIDAMISAAYDTFGAVDILVNNAGIQHVSPIESFPDEKWDAIISVDLSAAFHTSRRVLPKMRERDFGRIINIASVLGLVGQATKAAYVSAKHGIVGLTKVIALETCTTNVTCNAICPSWALTPLVQAQIELRAKNEGISLAEAQKSVLSDTLPSGRLVNPRHIGELAVFLCSPAAQEIRGAAIPIDGATSAR